MAERSNLSYRPLAVGSNALSANAIALHPELDPVGIPARVSASISERDCLIDVHWHLVRVNRAASVEDSALPSRHSDLNHVIRPMVDLGGILRRCMPGAIRRQDGPLVEVVPSVTHSTTGRKPRSRGHGDG